MFIQCGSEYAALVLGLKPPDLHGMRVTEIFPQSLIAPSAFEAYGNDLCKRVENSDGQTYLTLRSLVRNDFQSKNLVFILDCAVISDGCKKPIGMYAVAKQIIPVEGNNVPNPLKIIPDD